MMTIFTQTSSTRESKVALRTGIFLAALALPGTSACVQNEGPKTTETSEKAAQAVVANDAPPAAASNAAAEKAVAQPKIDRAAIRERAVQMFGSVSPGTSTENAALDEARVELGRALYYDKRLSKGQDISCNTCHDLGAYGVDIREEGGARLKTSKGHKGAAGTRNSPTVYGAFAHAIQFWDGRAKDVEEQAKGPVLNPVEMAMKDDVDVTKVLQSIPGYAPLFKKAFPEDKHPVSFENAAQAIGAFERKLVTPSPFDAFLAGKLDALTDEQVEGLETFVNVGCTTCHMGPSVGGAFMQKLGLMKPWPTKDGGRFEVTKNDADKFFFKTPSLRNIEKTGPYLHDGSIATLPEAVAMMAEHQTPGGAISPDKVEKIVSFLDGLTGQIDEDLIKEPALPQSGKKTPKPSRG